MRKGEQAVCPRWAEESGGHFPTSALKFFKAVQVSKSPKAVQPPGNQEKGWFVTHHFQGDHQNA